MSYICSSALRQGRIALYVGFVAASLVLAPSSGGHGRAQSEATVIGYTQMAQLLIVYSLGSGATPILIMGGQHGWPEENTVRLANQLYDYFARNPAAIPADVRLDFLVEANPDGLLRGSRQYLSGVDPNRNWDGPGWAPDTWDSNGVFRPGLGGIEPFSEPETRAIRDYVVATQPALVVNYHSRGGFLLGGRTGQGSDLADAYAAASGYYRPGGTPGGGGGAPSVLGYRATGSMNIWLGTVGVSGILIELSDSSGTEYARNLAGLQAALSVVATRQAADTMGSDTQRSSDSVLVHRFISSDTSGWARRRHRAGSGIRHRQGWRRSTATSCR